MAFSLNPPGSKIVNHDPPIAHLEFSDFDKSFSFPPELFKGVPSNLNDKRRSLYLHENPQINVPIPLLTQYLNAVLKDLLNTDSTHQFRRYRAEPETIIKKLNLAIIPTLDMAGFDQGTHLDNRLVVAAGSINLAENSCATEFFSNRTGDLIYRGSKSKNAGTIWLNTEVTWHRVPPVERDRTTLLIQWMWI